jgi:lysozyme
VPTIHDQLVLHEGLRLKPYRCTAGRLTIGVGRNLEDKGLTGAEALVLLEHDVAECERDLETFPWYPALDHVRQRVLIDMRFNMGPDRFRGFRQMLIALERGDFAEAAWQMLASKWAADVGDRATRLEKMMRTGQDYD